MVVSTSNSGIEIRVEDDGVGFDIERVPLERLGVRRSIIERMAQVGGVAEIHSRPGDGTRVTLRWPNVTSLDDSQDLSEIVVKRAGEYSL
jgi:signal transduction histidine kinase